MVEVLDIINQQIYKLYVCDCCILLQVLDETSKKCVYPDECPCPSCDPISQNCSNIINSSDDKCSCPICAGIINDKLQTINCCFVKY